MTRSNSKLVLLTILLMAFTVSAVHADWEVEQIESIYDDGMITETGGVFFLTNWVEMKGGSVSINSFFAFRGVSVPSNASIENAYLEFSAPFPWNYNQTLDATVYGLKQGDQPSWNPTPPLMSQTVTTAFTNFDIDPLVSSVQINVTVTEQVKEILGLHAWNYGNDMGFQVSAVPVSGGTRYCEAYDSNPSRSAKLYIEFTESTNTTFYYKGYVITESSGNLTQTATISDTTNATSKLFEWELAPKDFDQKEVNFGHGNNLNFDTVKIVGDNAYILANPHGDLTVIKWFETPDNGDTITANITIYDGLSTQEYYSQDYINGTFHIAYSTIGGEVYYNNVTRNINGTWTAYYAGLGLEIASHASAYAPQVLINPANNTIYVAYVRGTKAQLIKTQLPVMFGDGFWDVATNSVITATRSNVRVTANGTVYWSIWDIAGHFLRFYKMGAGHTWISDPWFLRATASTVDEYHGTAIGNISTTEFLVVGSTDTKLGVDTPQAHTLNIGIGTLTEYEGNTTAPFAGQSVVPYTLSNGIVRLAITRNAKGLYDVSPNWLGTRIEFDWAEKLIKGTTHTLVITGRDPALGSGGGGGYQVTFNGTVVSNSCLDDATTLEEIMACLDEIEGVTPDDPNPPGSTYPPDGVGALTRFNVRFYIWLMGWVALFVPMFGMAYRNWSIEYYFYFGLIMIAGMGLLWSIGSI